MSVIRILPEVVANKIAAGEVVERPASVVKELLENALDAGANQVEIYVESGGKRVIRVSDDGSGMSRDDAMLAFERHATSKIRSADDLLEISTLGFRGEALPSIASVARLLMETRHDSESAATRIEIAGGRLRDVKETARTRGTTIEVRDLFFNTPARRKFLKSESTELGHVASLVTHYALAQPAKRFSLTSLTNEMLNVPPVAGHRERLYQVLGGQMLEQLIEFGPVERRMPEAPGAEPASDDSVPDAPAVLRISGFVSRPEVQKLNRNQIYFFVNRRLVRDRQALHALSEAYRNILPAGMFPVALVFLEIPATEVDVNVHPSKTEVRFRRASFVHDVVRDAIRQALIAARPMAAFPARTAAQGIAAGAPAPASSPVEGARPAAAPDFAPRAGAANFHLSPPAPQSFTPRLPLVDASLSVYQPPISPAPASEPEPLRDRPQGNEFPADLRPLGQIEESFIVATNSEGLWLIDQHVAHERILFEDHLRRRRSAQVEGQRLLLPIVIELLPEQQAVFQDIADELSASGFEVEPFGQRTVAVKTAPAEVPAEAVEKLLLEILEGARAEARALTLDELRGKIAASVACHAAIKVHMPLDQTKMEWLLRELGRTECPMSCPHGRPILLRYTLKEIQKAFKRI